jgi:MFS family permease
MATIKNERQYGWIMVVVCFFISTIALGTRYSFGVFFKSLESDFVMTRTLTSAVFSSYMLLCPLAAILGGWALDRYGPRLILSIMGILIGLSLVLTSQTGAAWQLFLTYSLLLALGTGAIYTVLMTTISKWFNTRRGLALGIAGSGDGAATVVVAPLAAYLISRVGWRTTYFLMGLVAFLVIVALSQLLKRSPHESGYSAGIEKVESGRLSAGHESDISPSAGLSLAQAVRNRNFWLLCLAWLSLAFCFHLLVAHLVPHITDGGIPAADAAMTFSMLGMASIPGRLVMGWASDRIGRKPAVIISSVLLMGAMFWLAWIRDLGMFYLFAVVYGFSFGGFDAPAIALVSDTFGLRNLGVIMGALVVGWGSGAAIGPAVGGIIFDSTGSYTPAFLAGGAVMLLATMSLILIKHESRVKERYISA